MKVSYAKQFVRTMQWHKVTICTMDRRLFPHGKPSSFIIFAILSFCNFGVLNFLRCDWINPSKSMQFSLTDKSIIGIVFGHFGDEGNVPPTANRKCFTCSDGSFELCIAYFFEMNRILDLFYNWRLIIQQEKKEFVRSKALVGNKFHLQKPKI
jgi:hypothetical protein